VRALREAVLGEGGRDAAEGGAMSKTSRSQNETFMQEFFGRDAGCDGDVEIGHVTLRLGGDFLGDVADWIKEQLQPADVFDDGQLASWAEDWAKGQAPADVFGESELAEWAEANGYEKKED
jgi:hypothetical protein